MHLDGTSDEKARVDAAEILESIEKEATSFLTRLATMEDTNGLYKKCERMTVNIPFQLEGEHPELVEALKRARAAAALAAISRRQ